MFGEEEGCSKYEEDICNDHRKERVCKIRIAWAAQGFTESGRSFSVFFSTIPPDVQNIGNVFLGATWEILTHPKRVGLILTNQSISLAFQFPMWGSRLGFKNMRTAEHVRFSSMQGGGACRVEKPRP